MKKYVFKPYSNIFPELFQKEKERISSNLKELLVIEHVGSTAVPGLGGKGIIDSAIAVDKANMDSTSKELQYLGMSTDLLSAHQIDFISLSIYLIQKKKLEDIIFI